MTSEPTVGQLVRKVLDGLTGIVRGEVDLVKSQAKDQIKTYGLGAGLLAAGGFFGIFGFGWILKTTFEALSEPFQPWLAALIVTLVLLLITAVLVLVGIKKLKNPPEITLKDNLEKDVEAVKEGISS